MPRHQAIHNELDHFRINRVLRAQEMPVVMQEVVKNVVDYNGTFCLLRQAVHILDLIQLWYSVFCPEIPEV